jgi:hypothetical protein
MSCCAIARCSNPSCQVCTTVERGFQKATFHDITEQKAQSRTRGRHENGTDVSKQRQQKTISWTKDKPSALDRPGSA